MRRLSTVIACGLAFAGTTSAFAASPGTHGQPNQSCEEQTSAPPGFDSGGFANAETHYAGNGDGSLHANSDQAVSQYDVACFQVS
jgi:hypothetical protein